MKAIKSKFKFVVFFKYSQNSVRFLLFHLTCCTLWPLVTHSLPTLTLGWHSPLMRSAEFRPIRYAALSTSVNECCIKALFSVVILLLVTLLRFYFCSDPQCHQAPLVLLVASVWISCFHNAWWHQSACRCHSSPLGWSPGHQKLPKTTKLHFRLILLNMYIDLRICIFHYALCFTHISSHQLFRIIDRSYGCFSLGDVGVVIGVVGDQQHFCQREERLQSMWLRSALFWYGQWIKRQELDAEYTGSLQWENMPMLLDLILTTWILGHPSTQPIIQHSPSSSGFCWDRIW